MLGAKECFSENLQPPNMRWITVKLVRSAANSRSSLPQAPRLNFRPSFKHSSLIDCRRAYDVAIHQCHLARVALLPLCREMLISTISPFLQSYCGSDSRAAGHACTKKSCSRTCPIAICNRSSHCFNHGFQDAWVTKKLSMPTTTCMVVP